MVSSTTSEEQSLPLLRVALHLSHLLPCSLVGPALNPETPDQEPEPSKPETPGCQKLLTTATSQRPKTREAAKPRNPIRAKPQFKRSGSPKEGKEALAVARCRSEAPAAAGSGWECMEVWGCRDGLS